MNTWPHIYEPGNPSLTLLLLHGTGGDESSLLSLGRALNANANLLSPRGRVLEGGAPRWFRRLAEGVFDEDDLRVRAQELSDFIEECATRYGFEGQNVVAVGYSNGANIAAAMLLLHANAVLDGAILLRPMVPIAPAAYVELPDVPIWIGAGRRDPIVPVENSERLMQLFKDHGANVTLRWHNGGHELAREEFEIAARWLSETFPTS